MDLGPKYQADLYRFDRPEIIAKNRHLAELAPVELAYLSGGYPAGTVLARNTTSLLFEKYNDAGSSGVGVAAGVLLNPVYPEDFASTTGTAMQVMICRGTLYYSKLQGIDTNGIADLNARTYSDASGTQFLVF